MGSKLKRNPLFMLGLTGMIVTLAMQLGFIVVGIPGAADAWPIWVSCYAAWVTFLVIGFAMGRKK